MDMEPVSMKMQPEMLHAAAALARKADISLGQLIRDLLKREILRQQNARPPIRADEQLIAPLRARLANDLAHAKDWDELDHRLQSKGYVLRAAGGGLALHTSPGDARICKASELGFSYSRLMQRFRQRFPGHSHTWLAERFLNQPQSGVHDDTPEIDVVEPY